MGANASFTQIGFDIPDPSELNPEELQESIERGDFIGDELEEAQKLLEEKQNAEKEGQEEKGEQGNGEPDADGREDGEPQGSGKGKSAGRGDDAEAGTGEKDAGDASTDSGTDDGEADEGKEEESSEGDEQATSAAGDDTVTDKEEEELPQTVPLARLSKEVRRRKELEARLEQLEARLKAKPSDKAAKEEKDDIEGELDEYFIDDEGIEEGEGAEGQVTADPVLVKLNQQYLEHLDMGETDEAAKVFSKIQERQIAIAEERAFARIQAGQIQESINDAQPVYDKITSKNKDLFEEDPVAFDAFNAAIDKYAENGLTPKESVIKAASIMGLSYETTHTTEKVDKKAVDSVKKKQDSSRMKNLENIGKQPAPLKKVGQGAADGAGGHAKNLLQMSDEEYRSLSEEEKRRLRGDYLE